MSPRRRPTLAASLHPLHPLAILVAFVALLFLLVATVPSAAAPPTSAPATQPSRPSTRTGDLRTHDRFDSKILHNTRRLWVWLPPGYDQDPAARYPVLYLHDGQNCFDAATSFAGEWECDESARRLVAAGKVRPLILVGIDNAGAGRVHEYTPTRDARYNAGGRGADYARFVVDEVKPFIDRTYRTLPDRDHTAVAGSSLGALISLHLALAYPDTFSRVGLLSPSLQWDDRQPLRQAAAADDATLRRLRIWLDIGTKESNDPAVSARMLTLTRQLTMILQNAGLKENQDYRYLEAENAPHHESAWAARFPQMLEFLFPPARQQGGAKSQ